MRLATAWLLAVTALLAFTAAPLAADTYKIDTGHSSALFKIKHFNVANFYGVFKDFSGTVEYDAEKPDASSIDLTIQAASVDSRNDQRDGHIKSPDFLNAAEFPVIKFKSTKVAFDGDNVSITGNLTLHGVTKEVTATGEKTGQGMNPRTNKEIVGFEAKLTVDRTEFDMGFMAGPLSADVTFLLSIEATK